MDKKTAQLIIDKVKHDYNAIAEQFSYTRYREWHEFNLINDYLKDGMKILDLGCGNGRLLYFLKNNNIDYVGVDISEKLIEIANRLSHEKKLPSHQFICRDFTDLPFADQEFDLVVAIASIYHIPSKELRSKVVNEIARVLKNNGIVMITFWNMWQYSMIDLVLKNILLKLIGKSKYDFFDAERPWKKSTGELVTKRYCHAFTLRELKKITKAANLKILKSDYTKKGKPAKFWNGYNGVLIAKKIDES